MRKIRRAVFSRRRADSDDERLAMRHRTHGIARKPQSPRCGITRNQDLETGFVNEDMPRLSSVDYLGVDVDAEYVVAHFRKTGSDDETDVARTKNGNA